MGTGLRQYPVFSPGPLNISPSMAAALNRLVAAVERLEGITAEAPIFVDSGGIGPPRISFDDSSGVPDALFARVVGRGYPTTTHLTATFAHTDDVMHVGDLEGSIPGLPDTPFPAQVGNDIVDVTDVDGDDWTVSRRPNPSGVEIPDYSLNTRVQLLRQPGSSSPLAFVEVYPKRIADTGGGAGWEDNPSGVLGVVDGAKLTDDAALLFAAILGDSSVSLDDGQYTGAITTVPLYDLNDRVIASNGTVIVRAWRPPNCNYYVVQHPVPEPILATIDLDDRIDSAVVTTLADDVDAGASFITVTSRTGFPSFPTDPFTYWFVRIDNSWFRAYGGAEPDTKWNVVLIAGPDEDHDAGADVLLTSPGFGWKEMTQTQSDGTLETKVGGRFSGSDPGDPNNEPAYPWSLPPILPDGTDYDFQTGNNPVVWIYPGLAASEAPTQASRYWIFEFPPKPATSQLTNYQQTGLVDGDGVYTIQWHGVGVKASDGWATGYPEGAGGPLDTTRPYSYVGRSSADGVRVGDSWQATATEAPVGSTDEWIWRQLAKENYGYVAVFGLDPTSGNDLTTTGNNGSDTKAALMVTGYIVATNGIMVGNAGGGRCGTAAIAVNAAVISSTDFNGTWSGLHGDYQYMLQIVTEFGATDAIDGTGATVTIASDTNVAALTFTLPTPGTTNQGSAKSYSLWRLTGPSYTTGYLVKSGLGPTVTTYKDTGSFESGPAAPSGTGDIGGGHTGKLYAGIDRIDPGYCPKMFLGGALVAIGAGTPPMTGITTAHTNGTQSTPDPTNGSQYPSLSLTPVIRSTSKINAALNHS